MFCCRPKLSGDEESANRQGNAAVERKQSNYVGDEVKTQSNEKKHVPVDNEKQYNLDKKTRVPPRHKVDHVVSVKNENVYVKLSDMRLDQSRKPEPKTIFYTGKQTHYVSPPVPKHNVNIGRSVSYHCKNMAIPRAKLNVQRSNTFRESYPPAIHRVEYVKSEYVSSLPPRDATVSNKTDNTNSSEYKYVIKTNNATEEKSDTDSYSEEQRFALDQLDSTLNEYNIGEFDRDSPVIVTDILPYGVFEVDEKFDSGLESDVTPSSRTSSLSSNKSMNGIISTSKSKRDRRMTSVSFNLPPDHVDKPYQPMQSSRPKTPSAPIPIIPTISVTDYKNKVWSTNISTVMVEDHRMSRRASGPFKGSFIKLFYGKYAPKDSVPHDEASLAVSPRLMERVSSFESLTDSKLNATRGKVWVGHQGKAIMR